MKLAKFFIACAMTIPLLAHSTVAFSANLPENFVSTVSFATSQKPNSPVVVAVESGATYIKKKKTYVNVTVTVTHPDTSPSVTSKVVTGGGKTCTIKAAKTSCVLKQIPLNKLLTVKAKAKNKKGSSKYGIGVSHIAGGAKYPQLAAPISIVQTPVVAPTPTPTPTPTEAAPTCATGGTCALGDIGPGGGLIYYVSSAGFNCGMNYSPTGSPSGGKCNYLEVAPKNWNSLELGAGAPWFGSVELSDDGLDATPTGVEVLASTEKNSTIGKGYKNSLAISVAMVSGYVAPGPNGYAAEIAMDYRGGGKTDWFLPSSAELNALCNYSRQIRPNSPLVNCFDAFVVQDDEFRLGPFGMINNYRYWSSSVADGYSFANPWMQGFGSGEQDPADDFVGASYVNGQFRAIRAF